MKAKALYLSDAQRLQLWIHNQESDFTAFDRMLDLSVAFFFLIVEVLLEAVTVLTLDLDFALVTFGERISVLPSF